MCAPGDSSCKVKSPEETQKAKSPEETQKSYARLVAAAILSPSADGSGYVRVPRPSLPGIVQMPAQLAARLGGR